MPDSKGAIELVAKHSSEVDVLIIVTDMAYVRCLGRFLTKKVLGKTVNAVHPFGGAAFVINCTKQTKDVVSPSINPLGAYRDRP